jgi:hypothetical protein
MEYIEHRIEKVWVAATVFVLSAAGVMLFSVYVEAVI